MSISKNPFDMPVLQGNSAYPEGPYRFIDREFFIITYETDEEALRKILPKGLEMAAPVVKYEFIKMPNSSGFGDYTESGQVIPVIYEGKPGGYVHSMYLGCHPPIAAGREIWGFPKKLGYPNLEIDSDTLLGTLDYGQVRVATGTMGYKFESLDKSLIEKALQEQAFLVKSIPGVDGKPQVCQLVRYYLTEINVRGAWAGPAALELHPHALAPVADLPIKKVISAVHFITDLTLPYGEVVVDYLK